MPQYLHMFTNEIQPGGGGRDFRMKVIRLLIVSVSGVIADFGLTLIGR